MSTASACFPKKSLCQVCSDPTHPALRKERGFRCVSSPPVPWCSWRWCGAGWWSCRPYSVRACPGTASAWSDSPTTGAASILSYSDGTHNVSEHWWRWLHFALTCRRLEQRINPVVTLNADQQTLFTQATNSRVRTPTFCSQQELQSSTRTAKRQNGRERAHLWSPLDTFLNPLESTHLSAARRLLTPTASCPSPRQRCRSVRRRSSFAVRHPARRAPPPCAPRPAESGQWLPPENQHQPRDFQTSCQTELPGK